MTLLRSCLVLLFLLPACSLLDELRKDDPPAPDKVTLEAKRWDVRYGIDLPAHPVQDGSGWKLDVREDRSRLGYLTCPHTAPLKGSVEMRISVEADGAVRFDGRTEAHNTDSSVAASVRFMLYRDMTGEFGRWWSNPACIVLEPGVSKTLKVSLDPKNWSSVNGSFGNASEAARKGFAEMLAKPAAVGMTFGGGYFFGHGVYAREGDATIRLSKFTVK